jgi:hypothetical protein
LTELYRVGVERRPAPEAVSAEERFATLLTLMSDGVEAAERCLHDIGIDMGRGGDRRKGKKTPENELIEASIQLYTEFSNRFPKACSQAALGQSGKQFIRELLGHVDPELGKPTRITDAAINATFGRLRKSQ